MTTLLRNVPPPCKSRMTTIARACAWRAVVSSVALAMAACTLPVTDKGAAAPVPTQNLPVDVGPYLDLMVRLGNSEPAQQADLFYEVERTYASAPTTANSLRYAVALVTPGHSGSNAANGKKMLETLLASPERMLTNERLLASVVLVDVAIRLKLEADSRRVLATVDERARSQANSDRRAQTLADENARLRKALEEAQAKLDAIRAIERTIIERNPSPPGTAGPRSESSVEAQSPPAGR